MELLSSGQGILLAILGIGFVIAIHELGHFLFAKWAGVRVLEFAIGFGPGLWTKRIGETEYSLRLIPAGGYVAMQEHPNEEDPDGTSFSEASPLWKSLILIGGVLFNVISSFVLLLTLAWTGMPLIPPQVGDVAQTLAASDGHLVDSPASKLGVRAGDHILAINDKPVRSFSQFASEVVVSGNQPITLVVERDGQQLTLPSAGSDPVTPVTSQMQGMPTLGIGAPTSRRVVLIAGENTGDLRVGDRIQRIGDTDVSSLIGQQLDDILLPYVGRSVDLTVARDGASSAVSVQYAGSAIGGFADASVGLPVLIREVLPGMSAAEAGVQAGDILRAVGGDPVRSADHFRSLVRAYADSDEPFSLSLWRFDDEAQQWSTVEANVETRIDEHTGRQLIGVSMVPLRTGMQPPAGLALGSGEASPLADAGLELGDAIIHVAAAKEGDATNDVTVQVLRGGRRVLIDLTKEEQRALLRPYDPPLLYKFFRAELQYGVAVQLQSTRIVGFDQIDDTERILALAPFAEQENSNDRAVSLARIPEDLQKRLTDRLQPGDWVVGLTASPKAYGALEIIRGVSSDPIPLRVRTGDPGIAFAFDVEELPYELEHWHDAFGLAADSGWDILDKTFRVVGAFFKSKEEGGVDPSKSLHGPVGIFTALKDRAEAGFASFVNIVALLGLNLVIVNLLPLPIADGGRLVVVLIETVIRRPLPERVINTINLIGVALVIMLMVFVLGVDVLRINDLH